MTHWLSVRQVYCKLCIERQYFTLYVMYEEEETLGGAGRGDPTPLRTTTTAAEVDENSFTKIVLSLILKYVPPVTIRSVFIVHINIEANK